MGMGDGVRAEAPRAATSAAVRKAMAEWGMYRRERERLERVSVLRGLVWLAGLVLVVSVLLAGWDRAFYAGWWRQW